MIIWIPDVQNPIIWTSGHLESGIWMITVYLWSQFCSADNLFVWAWDGSGRDKALPHHITIILVSFSFRCFGNHTSVKWLVFSWDFCAEFSCQIICWPGTQISVIKAAVTALKTAAFHNNLCYSAEKFSGDLNNELLNNGNIWKTKFYLFAIQMPGNSSLLKPSVTNLSVKQPITLKMNY